jgi:flagellar protein FlgJ
MRQPDLSFPPGLSPTAPTAPTRPTAPIGGGAAGFGAVFSEVGADVADFIRNGGGTMATGGTAAAALSPEGWAARSGAASGIVGSEGVDGIEGHGGDLSPEQQAFLDSIAPWAKEAGQRLGVAPELVSAHAALESGWGRLPLRNPDGSSTHNLFGIKAGGSWDGAVAESRTTEYIGGAAVKTNARFRAYPDAASAFRDYAHMLAGQPRFRGALGAGSDAHAFATGLAKGGYATDPAYAGKLTRLAGRLAGAGS